VACDDSAESILVVVHPGGLDIASATRESRPRKPFRRRERPSLCSSGTPTYRCGPRRRRYRNLRLAVVAKVPHGSSRRGYRGPTQAGVANRGAYSHRCGGGGPETSALLRAATSHTV
jgi:hypothetical protein